MDLAAGRRFGEGLSAESLSLLGAEAALQTARDLANAGFDAAWAEGSDVFARKDRHIFVMHNVIKLGAPGNRERMLDLYAAMVVRNLLAPGPE